jgi:hypothetical protein
VHVNICESHASHATVALAPPWRLQGQVDTVSQSVPTTSRVVS